MGVETKYKILDFISKFKEGVHYARIWEYAKEKLGLSSKGTVSGHLEALIGEKWVERDRKYKRYYSITHFGSEFLLLRKDSMRYIEGYEEPHELKAFLIRTVHVSEKDVEKRIKTLVDVLKRLGFASYGTRKYKFGGKGWTNAIALTGPGPFMTEQRGKLLGIVPPLVEVHVSKTLILFYTYLPTVPSGPSLESMFNKKDVLEMLEKWADVTERYISILFKVIFDQVGELCPIEIKQWVKPQKVDVIARSPPF